MKSGGVKVIVRDLSLNPSCQHGPTILFSRDKNKFFACSCFRNNCFRMELKQFERNSEKILRLQLKKYESNNIIENIHEFPIDQRIYCFTCQEVSGQKKFHAKHQFKMIDDQFLEEPSLFLPQLDNDKLNAQYFFDTTTLQFIHSIFISLDLNKIICVGSPRLHDYLRVNSTKSMLLDVDNRFQPFYPNEFCHYNLFNHHFFNGQQEASKLIEFLKDDQKDETSHHCIFVDPPFAGRTELLTITLKTLSNLYYRTNHKIMPIILTFPYFQEAHIDRDMPELEMLDFQVTYSNHVAFNQVSKGRKEGSPVRFFTNINQSLIKYPSSLSHLYRYCEQCNRSVALNNIHCKICNICPSKNGSTYRHCSKCKKCVKPNYVHCDNCQRCVLSSNHDCKIYQKYQECRACYEKGHVEKYCKKPKNKIF